MKIVIIIASIVFLLITFSQIYVVMAGNKTETQTYTIVKKEAEFEIRYYPVATLAVISQNAVSYRELGSNGFRKLAGFIFGGNTEKQSIAMTAPVHMEMNDSIGTMAFVMPNNYSKDNLPKPNDSSIEIKTTTAEYVAAIEFGGFADTEKINSEIAKLKALLLAKQIKFTGNFRYLGYNPPYQLIDRRNEIVVTVEFEEAKK